MFLALSIGWPTAVPLGGLWELSVSFEQTRPRVEQTQPDGRFCSDIKLAPLSIRRRTLGAHQPPPQPPTPASTHPALPAPAPAPPSPHPPTHSAPAGWPHPHCHCPSARKYPASRPCVRQSTGG